MYARMRRGRHRSQAIEARDGPIKLLNLVAQQFARFARVKD